MPTPRPNAAGVKHKAVMTVRPQVVIRFAGDATALAGLVLTTLLTAGWYRSLLLCDVGCRGVARQGVMVRTAPGRIRLLIVHGDWESYWDTVDAHSPFGQSRTLRPGVPLNLPPPSWVRGDFTLYAPITLTNWPYAGSTSYIGFGAPYWALLLVTGVPSLTYASLRLRARSRIWNRTRLGQCQRCGYDVRVNSGQCPECGAEVGKQTNEKRATDKTPNGNSRSCNGGKL